MRDKQFSTKTETSKQRSQRMKKNRLIRKQKLYGTVCSMEQPESKETSSNNREQKQYIQKLKNRQAAQKSRQQKKMYVTQLEEEIIFLKHKLTVLSHCEKCQKQLQIEQQRQQILQTYHQNGHRTEMIATQTIMPTYQQQRLSEQESLEEQEEESQFFRMSSTGENSSIGIYLFVFMIILGVFCIGNRMDVGDSGSGPLRRDLTQMFNVPLGSVDSSLTLQENQYNHEYENNMKSTYSTLNEIDLINPQSYQNGLLSMDQVKSPSAISDQKYFEKIITSFQNYKLNHQYDEKNLRSKVSLVDANKSLMFCNRPKIYRSNPNNQGVFSSFIDIFVKGAEIMNIFPHGQSQLTNPNNFQLDGLYKITASVQEIQQIGNPNFIY